MSRRRKKLTLSPAQEAELTAALQEVMREWAAAQDEIDDLTPDEWRAMKKDAAFGRTMRRKPSEVSDDTLLKLYEEASAVRRRSGPRLGERPLGQREKYERIAREVGLAWKTVCDRICTLKREGKIAKK